MERKLCGDEGIVTGQAEVGVKGEVTAIVKTFDSFDSFDSGAVVSRWKTVIGSLMHKKVRNHPGNLPIQNCVAVDC